MDSFDIGVAEGMVKVAVSKNWIRKKTKAAIGKAGRFGEITRGDVASVADNAIRRVRSATDKDARRRLRNAYTVKELAWG